MPKNKGVSNYRIVKHSNGQYRYHYMIQDGWESGDCSGIEDGVKQLKKAAKIMNGTKIKRKDISYGEEYQKVVNDINWSRLD